METYFYDLRYLVDKKEWRARAKRDLVFQLWEKYRPQNNMEISDFKQVNILDFGCGTGVLQEEFEKRFNAKGFGIDVSKKAISYCKKRGLNRIKLFDGNTIPFKDQSFDLVTAIDVLEHIEDDLGALKEIKRVLKKGGLALLLVPAHPHLWSTRDINLKHFRRYRVGELEDKCKKLGFKLLDSRNVDFVLYFLFSLICLLSPKKNGIPNLKMDTATASSNKFINEIIFMYEQLENKLQQFTTFPIGLSIAVVVQKI